MITNRYIMVYYHCYYILDKASSRNPELFYKDWKKFEKLLDHENSYHRTIGLVMLSNLIPADKEKLFDKISDKYFMFINDKKITTARDCVTSTGKILRQCPDYIDKVMKLYLNMEKICEFKENQKALLLYDMFVIFEEFYEKTSYKNDVKKALGENMGVAAYPTVDFGNGEVQMKAFLGVKLFAVNQQTQAPLAAMALANFLSNESSQLVEFEKMGVIPSNKNLQTNETVLADDVAKAVMEMSQTTHSVVMPKIPEMVSFWPAVDAVINDTFKGNIKEADYMNKLDALVKDTATVSE